MLEELKELLSKYVDDVSNITEGSSLSSDVGLSSMDFFVFIGDIEEKYGIKIHDKEFVKLQTVGDFLRVVEGAKQ